MVAMVTFSLALLGLLARGAAHTDTTFTVNTTGDGNGLDLPGGSFDGALVGRHERGLHLADGRDVDELLHAPVEQP